MTPARSVSLIPLALALLAGATLVSVRAADAADRTQQARQLVTSLVKRDYASVEKTFDSEVKSKLPADKLKATWEGLIAQVGAFQKQGAAHSQTIQQGGKSYDLVVINCQFAKMPLDVRVSYNTQGQVAGLLRISRKQNAPATIGDAINVIVTRMHVQRVRGERARSNMKNDRQAFARYGIKDFLHQDQTLT